MNDLVSIIMPAYNTEKYIEKSIKSVLNQTYTNWELIIIDDFSTDNTTKIVSKYIIDSRITLYINEKNFGAAICRNIALRRAKGKYIAFLDSDDLWKPEKLEKQISFMKKNGIFFSYTHYIEIDETGKSRNIRVSGPKHIGKMWMYGYCWLGCLTVIYDREYVGLIQIKDIKRNNDYAMWLKICKKSECFLLPEVLAFYRRSRYCSISNTNYINLIQSHYKLFRYAENYSILYSIINTLINLIFGIVKKILYVKRINCFI